MLRPGRHQQAEAIVNSLRSKAAKSGALSLKKSKRAIKKAARSHTSHESNSSGSFRVARHSNGTQSRVFIKILESPPQSLRGEVEGHEVAATVKNVLKRLLKPRLVTENTLARLDVVDGRIQLGGLGHSDLQAAGQAAHGSTSTAPGDVFGLLDRAALEKIKSKFSIQYLY